MIKTHRNGSINGSNRIRRCCLRRMGAA